MVTDLQALASTATGYYTDNHQLQSNMPMNYGQQSQQGSQGGYYAPTAQSGPGVYGQVYYQDPGSHAAFNTGKQGFNALNNLVPDIHNGSFDPRSYTQVSSRLNFIRSSGIPFLQAGGMADYQPVAAATSNEGAHGVFGPTTHYSLPSLLPNLRTKSDLHAADSRYAQMQTTIYENSNQLAAAGVAQPEMHYVQNGIVLRHSQSPPSRQLLSPHQNGPSSIAIPAANSPPNHHGTPGLTPPSSASTYSSGHSPTTNYNLSPTQTSSTMYPTLPNSAATSTGYFPSSMAPSSALGTQFDNDSRHRHGGGTLQKARPLRPIKAEEAMDTSDDSCTTPTKAVSSSKDDTKLSIATRNQVQVPSSNIDPALSGLVSSPGGSGELDEGAIRANEIWVEQARTIEALRKWVQGRLAREDFEIDGQEGSEEGGMGMKMELKQEQGQDEVFYPSLGV